MALPHVLVEIPVVEGSAEALGTWGKWAAMFCSEMLASRNNKGQYTLCPEDRSKWNTDAMCGILLAL